MQVFAAHRVVGPGDLKARRARFQKNATDPLPAWLTVDAAEDDEHAGLSGTADQGFGALQDDPIAENPCVGPVIRDIGAGMRLRHAHREDAVAADDSRKDTLPDRGWRVTGNDAGLHARLPQHGHGGHVVDLGDFLQNQGGVEDRQAEPAIFLGHRHPESSPSAARLFMFSQGKVPSIQRCALGLNSDFARATARRRSFPRCCAPI